MDFSSKEQRVIFKSFLKISLVLLFLISLSFSAAFAQPKRISMGKSIPPSFGFQSTDLDEAPYVDPFGYPYLYNGTPCYSWKVAEHVDLLWTIWAIDAVSGDILTGLNTANLAVVREGVTFGDLIVTSKFGYGNSSAAETLLG